MKNFIRKNKKGVIIAGIVLIVILLFLFVKLFLLSSIGNNKYGDRLDDIDKHKISGSTIDDIKDRISGKDGVEKVIYHQEGRILNFTITVDSGMKLDDAKTCGDIILDGIGKKNTKYYDVQVLIDTKDDSDVYPVIGYKSKNSDDITYGNAGGSSE